jgi:hypothetical protein
VVRIWLVLPAVPGVRQRHQLQRAADAGPVGGGELFDLDEQPLAQPLFAVQGGDRMQRHHRQPAPVERAESAIAFHGRARAVIGRHGRLRLTGILFGFASHVTSQPRESAAYQ